MYLCGKKFWINYTQKIKDNLQNSKKTFALHSEGFFRFDKLHVQKKYFCMPNFYLCIESIELKILSHTKEKTAQLTFQFVAEYESARGSTKPHFPYPICLLKTQTDKK